MDIPLIRRLSFPLVLLCVATLGAAGLAAPALASKHTSPASPAPAAAPAAATPAAGSDAAATPAASAAATDDFDDDPDSSTHDSHPEWQNRLESRARHRWHSHGDGDVVNIGHGSHLPSGQRADSVVSIFGSSTSEGEANDVVSVLGNTRVSGPVNDTAVAVLGNTYVDSKVDGDVVAVLGNVELGPNAEVGGDVVSVLGIVKRDPAAVVHGAVQRVFSIDTGDFGDLGWFGTWIAKCFFYARPLAFAPGLGWAWTLALVLLAFYTCLALLFRSGIDRCVETLESQPGHTALASLLAILLTPVLIVLLCITVIGIAAVPFVVGALFCAALFGKAVMLSWLGGRVINRRPGPAGHPAVAVLVGGAIVLVLYVVPVLGFVVYKLLGFFGMGTVVYTLILMARARRAQGERPPPFSGPSGAGPAPMAGAASMGGSATIPGATPAAAAASAFEASAGAASAGAAPPGAAPGLGSSSAATPPPSAATAAPLQSAIHYSASMPHAGFWIRMAALFLDVVLIGILMSLLHPFRDFNIVVLAIYGAVMWKLRGATVGGIVFDLHVVRLDGRPVDWETAIVRALGCFLSLFVVGLGFIWIAFDGANQAWHDKIAGTVVVRVKRAAALV